MNLDHNIETKTTIITNNIIENKLGQIEALDLEPIKYKLVKEKGWSLEAADRIAGQYKIYLQLHVLYPDTLHIPTVDIDEMWHAHILDTAKYMKDCSEIFGFYLHHFPYLGMKDEEDAQRLDSLFAETKTRLTDSLSPRRARPTSQIAAAGVADRAAAPVARAVQAVPADRVAAAGITRRRPHPAPRSSLPVLPRRADR